MFLELWDSLPHKKVFFGSSENEQPCQDILSYYYNNDIQGLLVLQSKLI